MARGGGLTWASAWGRKQRTGLLLCLRPIPRMLGGIQEEAINVLIIIIIIVIIVIIVIMAIIVNNLIFDICTKIYIIDLKL